ncbi:hypothetical protein Q0Z83_056690 [Actinoplanes sichuanensis]|nr:hypothetical protein Q0Z83_056690 [Actinoplanes sichuanensis]
MWRPASHQDIIVTGRLHSVGRNVFAVGGATFTAGAGALLVNVEPEPSSCADCLDDRIESLQAHLDRRPQSDDDGPFLG